MSTEDKDDGKTHISPTEVIQKGSQSMPCFLAPNGSNYFSTLKLCRRRGTQRMFFNLLTKKASTSFGVLIQSNKVYCTLVFFGSNQSKQPGPDYMLHLSPCLGVTCSTRWFYLFKALPGIQTFRHEQLQSIDCYVLVPDQSVYSLLIPNC